MRTGSLNILSEQFRQADKIIGRHREGKLPVDLEQSAMPHLARNSATVLAQPKVPSTRLRMRCVMAGGARDGSPSSRRWCAARRESLP
jgi:hypothetical protein